MAGGIIGSIIGAALPSITETVGKLVDRLVPDPVAAAQAKKELEEVITAREAALATMIQQQNSEQNAINLAEAQSNNWFAASWRPAAAWIAVAAFGYNVLLAPFLTWILAIAGVALGISVPVPPMVDNTMLWQVLTGLLGLGALRSVDKNNGVVSPSQAQHNPAIPRR
jgi:hypothetical protein